MAAGVDPNYGFLIDSEEENPPRVKFHKMILFSRAPGGATRLLTVSVVALFPWWAARAGGSRISPKEETR